MRLRSVHVLMPLCVIGLLGLYSPGTPGQLICQNSKLTVQSVNPNLTDAKTSALFVIKNTGNTIVRIISVRTSCGCTNAKTNKEIVNPSESIDLTAIMDPIDVGLKSAIITVETDSGLTPTLNFQVIEEGYLPPPYIFQVQGDLYFNNHVEKDQKRKINIQIVSDRSNLDIEPILETDASFLKIEKETTETKASINDPSLFVINHHYFISLKEAYPLLGYQGSIDVKDPWNKSRNLSLNVVIEKQLLFKSIPSVINIKISSKSEIVKMKLLLICPSDIRRFEICEAKDIQRFDLSEMLKINENTYQITLKIKKDQVLTLPASFQIMIKGIGKSEHYITLPVITTRE